ncbi:ATPase domain-containing protein [Gemmatimonas sp.]|jgi:circadian clock protein KaiC|uniref:ATPase domain-containing protein n=1 Tax=Gemmatimonas sp. TaxID=1962908 RepID=UPI0039188C5C
MKDTTMSSADAAHALTLLATGVPGLDAVLGGGLPALSFNLVAGGPGSGKTTLAMQLLFATATKERPGLFITLLGETSLKMLRYQQCFDFFDEAAVGQRVHFLNLSEEALGGDLDAVLARIVHEVDALRPGMVVVDSFRSLVHAVPVEAPHGELERFVQRLALHLTTWDVTSLLIGEYQQQELRNPVFTVADGIFWLTQDVERNSVVRKLQVVKSRGVSHMPGLHTLKITTAGVQVFPRVPIQHAISRPTAPRRLSSGIAGLDDMMGGGIPAGDSLVLAGPTGSGKTTFAMHFVQAGLEAGEAAVVAVFEERPDVYLARAARFSTTFAKAIEAGTLRVIYLRPLDLSVDETLQEINRAVQDIGASRVVIDSINGFEMALAPTFREDFRESLYRLIGTLTSLGVTMFSTVELETQERATLTGYRVSFLTDIVLSQRYVEIEGELLKALLVVKMRGSDHSRAFRLYSSTAQGVSLGDNLKDYDAIMTGTPMRRRHPIP